MMWEIYSDKIKKGLESFVFDPKIPEILRNSKEKNQKIFIGGNGGSASVATQYVCDFSKGANQDWSVNFNRYKVISLVNNLSYMTAIANDAHYDDIFREQLINLASKEDILILISSSGNSKNIIKALECAKEKGMITIGVTGFNGGKLKKYADYSAHVPIDSYEVSEDIAQIFGHFLAISMRGG